MRSRRKQMKLIWILFLLVFIKFTTTDGKEVFINPSQITAVKGDPLKHITRIDTNYNGSYYVQGQVQDVISKLSNPE